MRERTEKGKKTVEVVHGITSLPPERADAKRLLELTQGHWGIENGLHYRRDVTLAEDASRIRKGVAPQIMAALRSSVIHVLSEVAAPNLALAVRTMGNCLFKALGLLGLPQLKIIKPPCPLFAFRSSWRRQAAGALLWAFLQSEVL